MKDVSMKMKLLGVVAAIAVTIVSAVLQSSAHAATLTFDWSWDGGGGGYGEFTGQGTLTANTTTNPNVDIVTSISGTWSAPHNFAGAETLALSTYNFADNLIYPSSSSLLDVHGIAIELSNGADVSILLTNSSNLPEYFTYDTYGTESFGSFSLTQVSSSPLPAALPLFATGLGALGLLGWRRKRKNAAAFATA
jgi:hypothetical protein